MLNKYWYEVIRWQTDPAQLLGLSLSSRLYLSSHNSKKLLSISSLRATAYSRRLYEYGPSTLEQIVLFMQIGYRTKVLFAMFNYVNWIIRHDLTPVSLANMGIVCQWDYQLYMNTVTHWTNIWWLGFSVRIYFLEIMSAALRCSEDLSSWGAGLSVSEPHNGDCWFFLEI